MGGSMIINLLVQLQLARLIGPEEFGYFSCAIAWLGGLTMILAGGVANAGSRFIPTYLSNADGGRLLGFITWSLSRTLTTSVVIALVVYIVADNWISNPGMVKIIKLTGFVLPVATLFHVACEQIRGFKQVELSVLFSSLLLPLVFLISIAVISLKAAYYSAADLFTLRTLILLFVLFLAGFTCMELMGKWRSRNGLCFDIDNWKGPAISLSLLTSVGIIKSQVDILMLGLFANEVREIGFYSVAKRLAGLVSIGLLANSMLVIPHAAELIARKETEELRKLLAKSSVIIVIPSIVIFVLLGSFGIDLLRLFGEAFSESYYLLLILMVGQIAYVISGPAHSVLAVSGAENLAFKLAAINALFTVTACFALGHIFGVVGVAIGNAVGLAIFSIQIHYTIKAKLGVSTSVMSLFRK
jgi:O-antigen/teichoic acid export membrane protein